MSGRSYSLCQFQFSPSKFSNGLDVPFLLLARQLRFQNDHVLRPADAHCFSQHIRAVRIGAVKIPHSAQVPRGETGNVWVCIF